MIQPTRAVLCVGINCSHSFFVSNIQGLIYLQRNTDYADSFPLVQHKDSQELYMKLLLVHQDRTLRGYLHSMRFIRVETVVGKWMISVNPIAFRI